MDLEKITHVEFVKTLEGQRVKLIDGRYLHNCRAVDVLVNCYEKFKNNFQFSFVNTGVLHKNSTGIYREVNGERGYLTLTGTIIYKLPNNFYAVVTPKEYNDYCDNLVVYQVA